MLSNDFGRNQDEVNLNILRFEKMLENNQNEYFDLVNYEQIIEFYLEENKVSKALEACNLALESFPFSLEVTLHKAQILANYNKLNEALGLLEELQLMYPSDKDINFLKANILMLNENYLEAVEMFIELRPFYSEKEEILMNIGTAYQKLGNYDLAIPFYQEAIELNAENQEIFTELIFCLYITEQLEANMG
ncbi:MAG: tetratricopeptide repeat protein, partial [Bacteroidota bacterium]